MADAVKVKEKIDLSEFDPEQIKDLARRILEANNGQIVVDGEVITWSMVEKAAIGKVDLSGILNEQTTTPENLAEMVKQAEEAKRKIADDQQRQDKIKAEGQKRIVRATQRGLIAKKILEAKTPEEIEQIVTQEIQNADKIVQDFSKRPEGEQVEAVLERVAMDEKTEVVDRQKILQEKPEIIEQIHQELEKEPVVEAPEAQQEVKPEGVEESAKVSEAPEGVVQQSSRSVRQMPISSPESTDKKTVTTEKETFVYRAGEGLKRGKWRSAQANRNLEAEQKIFERQRKSGSAFKLTFNPKTWVEWVKNGFWGTGEVYYPEPAGTTERYQGSPPVSRSGGGGGGLLSSIKNQIGNFFGGKTKGAVVKKIAGEVVKDVGVEQIKKKALVAGLTKIFGASIGGPLGLAIATFLEKVWEKYGKYLKPLIAAAAAVQALLSMAIPLLLGFVVYKLGAALSSLFASLGPVTFSFGLFGGTVGGAVGWIFGGPLGALIGSGVGAGIGGAIGSMLSAAGGLGGLASAATGFFASGGATLVAVLPTLAIPVVGITLVAVTAFTIINTQIRNSAMVDFRSPGDITAPGPKTPIQVTKSADVDKIENNSLSKHKTNGISYTFSIFPTGSEKLGNVTWKDTTKIITNSGTKTISLGSGNISIELSQGLKLSGDNLTENSMVINTVEVSGTTADGKAFAPVTATAITIIGEPPLAALSCPVLGGVITCKSINSGFARCAHCSAQYRIDYSEVGCNANYGNEMAMDVAAGKNQAVILPAIGQTKVTWTYIGETQNSLYKDDSGRNQVARKFSAVVDGKTYLLSINHLASGTPILSKESAYSSGTTLGYLAGFAGEPNRSHAHIQISVNGIWVPAESVFTGCGV